MCGKQTSSYVTSGYAPISAKLVERILGGEGITAGRNEGG